MLSDWSAISETFTVLPPLGATITPSGPTTFCEGGSMVLDAGLWSSYLWSDGTTSQTTTVTTTDTFAPFKTGSPT